MSDTDDNLNPARQVATEIKQGELRWSRCGCCDKRRLMRRDQIFCWECAPEMTNTAYAASPKDGK
jgi:hypothetical protein